MKTLFPSKIIKYLTHNLRVVSTKIQSIDKSPFSKIISFSENDSPESFSLAILEINWGVNYECQNLLQELDKKVVLDLKTLFSD